MNISSDRRMGDKWRVMEKVLDSRVSWAKKTLIKLLWTGKRPNQIYSARYYYPLAQLCWRRRHSIWLVRPSVCQSVRHISYGVVLCALLLQREKLCILRPMLIYFWHIVVVHLEFSLSEKLFTFKLKPLTMLAHKDLLNKVLCALFP